MEHLQTGREVSFRRHALFWLTMMAMTLGIIEILAAMVLTIRPGIFGGHTTSLEDRARAWSRALWVC